MARNLVIVESPAKAKTIGKFLGRSYKVKASMGHLIDLPRSQFGVDVDENFKPKYITIRGKGKIVKELKDAVKKADRVLLATDPDREGEAISWHLANTLELDIEKKCRIEFHEITKKAVKQALENPRIVDVNRVNAQQARRILDRLVGYKLSPLLWAKVKRGLSAGRVQSVAVRLVCEREKEIMEFVSDEYWTVTGDFKAENLDGVFSAKLVEVGKEKVEISTEQTALDLKNKIARSTFSISSVKKKERRRYPAPPFTTSTLQQEASRKLGFTARKTMSVAQQLYEGLEISGEGSVGLITYIRTDSVRVSTEAQEETSDIISERFGQKYVPPTPPLYKTKTAGAQDAHEAIRPTTIRYRPEEIKSHLTKDQYRLYQLIWNRFVASQMAPAVFDGVSVELRGSEFLFRATGSRVKFDGFLVLYKEDSDEETAEEEGIIPGVEEGMQAEVIEVKPEQHFTQPPPRYSEAMLVKILEENGIGRPSTYAPTIDTILKRHYVIIEDKRFHPTELRQIVVDLLKENFYQIVDPEFTAGLEEKLDRIEEGREDWVEVIRDFYLPFAADLAKAEASIERVSLTDEVSDVQCEHCGRQMVYKYGRYGRFLACPGYPECKNIKSIKKELDVDCPNCGGKIVERRSKKGRRFYGCANYPDCTFISWYPPAKTSCPKCGSYCVIKRTKSQGEMVVCSKKECGYKINKETLEEKGAEA